MTPALPVMRRARCDFFMAHPPTAAMTGIVADTFVLVWVPAKADRRNKRTV
jgi:hypothetical protein